MQGGQDAHLFVLLGPSGAGKTTILRYLERSRGAESAPKYTTRPCRNTCEDKQDFIFCKIEDFPSVRVLGFESYGHLFGIQLEKIQQSLERGASHVTIVGQSETVIRLISLYPNVTVPIFVFCDLHILKKRILNDLSRAQRWPQVREEIKNIYSQLGCMEFLINNSGSKADTFAQVERLLSRL